MKHFYIFFFFISLLVACSPSGPSGTSNPFSTSLTLNQSELDGYVSYPEQELGFEAGSLATQLKTDLKLKLDAEISSPVWEGQTLQATSVALSGQYAVVSYNMQGQTYLGALDVIDLSKKNKPSLTTRLLYKNADVNAVSVRDGNVYAVLATENKGSSYTSLLQVLPLDKDGKLALETSQGMKVVGLQGYAGTSVLAADQVLVTSGDNAGLSVLDGASLELRTFVELDDARWVDQVGRYIAVLQGNPGRLSIFDEKLVLQHEVALEGLDSKEAKSMLKVLGTTAFVSTGNKGAALVDLETGSIMGEIGFDSGFNSNALAVDSNFVFIAGGAEGIYAAYADHNFMQPISESLALDTLGKLALKDFDSANHVVLSGSTLVVASGLGGVKIINLEYEKLELESVSACEWKVSNPNNFPVAFSWQTSSSDAVGYVVAEADTETSFRAPEAKEDLQIVVNGEVVDSAKAEKKCGVNADTELSFKIVNDWFNNNGKDYGFQAEIRLTNTSTKTISDWEINFDLEAKFSTIWNASAQKKDGHVRLRALGWNNELKPGESITVGMTGTAEEKFDKVDNLSSSVEFDD